MPPRRAGYDGPFVRIEDVGRERDQSPFDDGACRREAAIPGLTQSSYPPMEAFLTNEWARSLSRARQSYRSYVMMVSLQV